MVPTSPILTCSSQKQTSSQPTRSVFFEVNCTRTGDNSSKSRLHFRFCVLWDLAETGGGECRLTLELALASKRQRSPTAVTLLVTATAERLDMLPGLCASWRGVLSVAVYVAHLAPTDAARPEDSAAQALAGVREVFAECAAVPAPHTFPLSWCLVQNRASHRQTMATLIFGLWPDRRSRLQTHWSQGSSWSNNTQAP